MQDAAHRSADFTTQEHRVRGVNFAYADNAESPKVPLKITKNATSTGCALSAIKYRKLLNVQIIS